MIQISGGAVTAAQLPGAAVPNLPEDNGLIGWSCPVDYARDVSLASVEVAAGTLRLSRIRRLPAASITNLHLIVTTAGSGLTAGQCFAALYTAAGALIGVTADQSTAWASSGVKSMAIAGGPVSVAAGDYYVGFWYNGTTAPTVLRAGLGSTSGMATIGQASGTFNAANANTGLTTTAPASLGTQTASLLRWWVAVS